MIANRQAVLGAALKATRQGRTVILDLDNTLFREFDFLFQAYGIFTEILAPVYGFDACEAKRFLAGQFKAGGRRSLLQEFARKYDADLDVCRRELFLCLRERPLPQQLSLFPWADEFLDQQPDMNQLAIITNGNPQQQANKIVHLPRLSDFPRGQIIFANNHAPKPAPDAAETLRGCMDVSDPLYIGDSDTDAAFATAANYEFFRVNFQLSPLAVEGSGKLASQDSEAILK